MATRSSRTRQKKAGARRKPDAIALLREDHARVQEMFDRFEKTRGEERKQKLVTEICEELKVHTQIEEEIFYPAVREAIDEADLMDEALVEHQSAKDLIGQLEGMDPEDELYDAKVTVLGEYVKHHVKEEQSEMFPKARKADLDLAALADTMRERKSTLMGEGGSFGRLKKLLR
ncbi:MAG TPA: hemerythrin domain-containing protein [Myxococcota bacterium]|jgi:hemerythrin superfamily protein|nr:hemerythrin domain-containing protein [Myxococcota bacterium]